jgi:Ca2+-transporting ATPase
VANAPFGFALGFDKETPGLMALRPRPRGESVVTRPMVIHVTLTGLAISSGLLTLIEVGTSIYDSEAIGSSIAFTSFSLCLIVAAFECRNETGTVLTPDTFDSRQMNWVALAELILAVLVTQMDVFRRLLGTTEINAQQFGWALLTPVGLLILWELGKWIARRRVRALPAPAS